MKETRIALIGIIIEEEKGITPTNQLLHEYQISSAEWAFPTAKRRSISSPLF